MPGLPEITTAGTLVADPELKFIDSGAAVVNFTIAANDRRYDRERGEWIDAGATFLRCSLWRQAAENVAQSLHKGDRVLVTGALKQREWTTEQGEKRTAFELAVNEIGPSLKFATAKVAKATRTTAGGNGTAASAEDVWTSGPSAPATAGTGRASDEPPF